MGYNIFLDFDTYSMKPKELNQLFDIFLLIKELKESGKFDNVWFIGEHMDDWLDYRQRHFTHADLYIFYCTPGGYKVKDHEIFVHFHDHPELVVPIFLDRNDVIDALKKYQGYKQTPIRKASLRARLYNIKYLLENLLDRLKLLGTTKLALEYCMAHDNCIPPPSFFINEAGMDVGEVKEMRDLLTSPISYLRDDEKRLNGLAKRILSNYTPGPPTLRDLILNDHVPVFTAKKLVQFLVDNEIFIEIPLASPMFPVNKSVFQLTIPMQDVEREGKIDVFIAHKAEDLHHAKVVYDYLVEGNLVPFLDKLTLPEIAHAKFREAIDQAIARAKHMVIVASKNEYLKSEWVKAEWDIFINMQRQGFDKGNLLVVNAGELDIEALWMEYPSLMLNEVISLNDIERLGPYVGITDENSSNIKNEAGSHHRVD
ncbi:TIR domain-containing protein [Candidatus Bathyarchaeota archaeon]|nr:TIR domain-containing protein [Candidatus Bathyarchaeota archaeon]